MAVTKEREDLRHKTVAELELALRDAKAEIYEVRTKIATRQQEDNNHSKMLRRRIARIHTIIGEKIRAGEPAGVAPTEPAKEQG